MRSTILGLFFGLGIIVLSTLTTTEDYTMYLDWMSFVIVFGGTVSVGVLTYGISDVFKMLRQYVSVFKLGKYTEPKIVEELVTIAESMYKSPMAIDGHIKNQKLHPFLRDGLELIRNNFDLEKTEFVMRTAIAERKTYFAGQIDMMKVIAKYPPAFGMIGTIIGLIGVLQLLGSMDSVDSLGPNMAVALITTLYGLFIANYIFNPIADFLTVKSKNDLKIRRIILGGIVLIQEKHDFIYVREVLLNYLLPKDRINFQKKNKMSQSFIDSQMKKGAA